MLGRGEYSEKLLDNEDNEDHHTSGQSSDRSARIPRPGCTAEGKSNNK